MSERLATVALSGAPGISSEVWKSGPPGALEFLMRLDRIDPEASIHEAVAQMAGPPYVPDAALERLPESMQQAYADAVAGYSTQEWTIDSISNYE